MKLNTSDRIEFQWAPKWPWYLGSWQCSPFNGKCKKKGILKRGYNLILIGERITWLIQINDAHIYHPLKAAYQQEEMKSIINKLIKSWSRVTEVWPNTKDTCYR